MLEIYNGSTMTFWIYTMAIPCFSFRFTMVLPWLYGYMQWEYYVFEDSIWYLQWLWIYIMEIPCFGRFMLVLPCFFKYIIRQYHVLGDLTWLYQWFLKIYWVMTIQCFGYILWKYHILYIQEFWIYIITTTIWRFTMVFLTPSLNKLL